MLATNNLKIGYNNSIIQHNLNIEANQGLFVCLLGKNGCGKSTLLRTLSGLQIPLDGMVQIDGNNLFDLSDGERAKHLSVVLTDKIDIDNATVRDVVSMGRYPYTSFMGSLKDEDNLIIDKALASVLMDGRDGELFSALSDGEKQRVVIGRALAQSTENILLDEPTSHLDIPNRIKIMVLLRQLAHEEGKTIICSTHDLEVALQVADCLWLMIPNNGGIMVGDARTLLENGAIEQVFKDDIYDIIVADGSLKFEFLNK